MSQPLVVVPDPRVSVPDEAYAQQFALAREVEALRVPVEVAQDQANGLIKELAVREETSAALRDQVASVLARASEIAEIPPTKFGTSIWWVAPTRVDSLRYATYSLGKLADAVDGADGAPSSDARTGVARMREPARRAVAEWKRFQETDLASLNAALKAAGEAELKSGR